MLDLFSALDAVAVLPCIQASDSRIYAAHFARPAGLGGARHGLNLQAVLTREPTYRLLVEPDRLAILGCPFGQGDQVRTQRREACAVSCDVGCIHPLMLAVRRDATNGRRIRAARRSCPVARRD